MIRYFVRHPTAANLLMAAFFILGAAVISEVRRETFPALPADSVSVTIAWPGASAEDVENAICLRVEEAVEGVTDLRTLTCVAREGLATVTLEMYEGADLDSFTNDIKNQIDAITRFPEAAEAPIISQLERTDRVASIAVTGPMSALDLKAYAEQLKTRLSADPRIATIEIGGFAQQQLRISFRPETLRQYGLSAADVANAVRAQNRNTPAGTLETGRGDFLIRFDDERRDLMALEDLVVLGEGGAELTLKDVADISVMFENDDRRVLFDGARAALMDIAKTRDQDALAVMQAIETFIETERERAPEGVRLEISEDYSSIISDRLNLLTKNGLQGLALVFLIMWLFFSLRHAFWVAMGLPVSFMGAIFVMYAIDYSFNMITLVGMLIAVGLLMDDAIVISENIAAKMKRGMDPMDAAEQGVRQVLPGVTMSYLTTMSVFGGLAFLAGDIGNVLEKLPVVLMAVLSISLIEAFLILPHHLAHAMQSDVQRPRSRLHSAFDRWFENLREQRVAPFLYRAIRHRYLTLGAVFGGVILSFALITGGLVRFGVFPSLEGDVVQARVFLPQGTPASRTEAIVDRLQATLEESIAELQPRQRDGRNLVEHVTVYYGRNRDAGDTGPHLATINVDLLDAEARDVSTGALIRAWRAATGPVPDVIMLNFTQPRRGPGGLDIDIRLYGPTLDELKAASLDLQAWLNRYEGVVNLSDDLRPGKPELTLRLKDGATALGLTGQSIADQLRAAFNGVTVDEYQVGPETVELDVRMETGDGRGFDAFDDFFVILPGGGAAPLEAVAEIAYERGYSRIQREDRRVAIRLTGEIEAGSANLTEILTDTQTRFVPDLIAKYPGIDLSFEGQLKEGQTTRNSIARNFVLGLIAIFLLLSFQFRSYIEPVIVMTAIPLGLIGMLGGHFLMGLEVTMPSLIGFAALAGVVVNDTILIVEFVKTRRRQGEPLVEAAALAARDRFRAIVLTSLTTVVGLLPMLLEQSLQAQVLVPLVASLAFGMLTSTVLSLVLVPSLYAVLDDFGLVERLDRRTGRHDVSGDIPDALEGHA